MATSKLVSAINKTVATPRKNARTANGAVSFNQTGSKVLDLFSTGGALRNQPESAVITTFTSAFNEDPLLALKVLFYLRDVKKGQGERRVFRVIWNWLSQNVPSIAKLNLANVPAFGRWDDLFSSVDTKAEKDVFTFLKTQLKADENKTDDSKLTLLAKWLPSINTSSPSTRALAKKFMKFLQWDERSYRKTLAGLRTRINVIEKLMCSRDWNNIDYSHVPSKASLLYRNSFKKRDGVRYGEYLSKVEKGEAKINTGALFPYDLIRALRSTYGENQTVELQWKNLTNFLADNPHNGIVVADLSGSMMSASSGNVVPMDVSTSLAIYFAERNVGIFKDYYITFSETARLSKITGTTLRDKYDNLMRESIVANTNLQSVFNLILTSAVKNKVPKSEMPDVIYIVSDMQFDQAQASGYGSRANTNFEEIERKYKAAGYKRPKLVFWNVNATPGNTPVKADDNGTILVSGCSPSIFTKIVADKEVTPYDFMLDTINDPRYDTVVVD